MVEMVNLFFQVVVNIYIVISWWGITDWCNTIRPRVWDIIGGKRFLAVFEMTLDILLNVLRQKALLLECRRIGEGGCCLPGRPFEIIILAMIYEDVAIDLRSFKSCVGMALAKRLIVKAEIRTFKCT